jgi:hypothetical protein
LLDVLQYNSSESFHFDIGGAAQQNNAVMLISLQLPFICSAEIMGMKATLNPGDKCEKAGEGAFYIRNRSEYVSLLNLVTIHMTQIICRSVARNSRMPFSESAREWFD